MIDKFITIYMENKPKLEAKFSTHPDDYKRVVIRLVEFLAEVMSESGVYEDSVPDKERVTVIDEGDYQGLQVFVIGCGGYQPSTYWVTSEYYGSCSGCDTLEATLESNWTEGMGRSEGVSEAQLKDYMTLCLHLLQSMVKVC